MARAAQPSPETVVPATPDPSAPDILPAGELGTDMDLGRHVVTVPGADGNVAGDADAYDGPVVDTFLVEVRKNETATIPVLVPEYEIEVLRLAHPEGIKVGDEPAGELQLMTKDGEMEFAKLVAKYETKNSPNPVLAVYPGGAGEFSREVGLEFSRARTRRNTDPRASEQVDHKTGKRT